MGIESLKHQAGVHFYGLDKVCKTLIGGSIPPRASNFLSATTSASFPRKSHQKYPASQGS
jgi:hypothetical protein